MRSKYRRGIDMVDKVKSGFMNAGLLVLVLASVALVPAVSTVPTYASSLKSATVKPSAQTAPVSKKTKTSTNAPNIISEPIKGVKISDQDLDEPLDGEEDENIGNSSNCEYVRLRKFRKSANNNKDVKQD
jgi:hypothetical protein